MLAFENMLKVGGNEMWKMNHGVARLMKIKKKERSLAMRKHIYNESSNENQICPAVEEFFKIHRDST